MKELLQRLSLGVNLQSQNLFGVLTRFLYRVNFMLILFVVACRNRTARKPRATCTCLLQYLKLFEETVDKNQVSIHFV